MRKILCIGSASVDIKAFSYQEDIQNAYREGTIDLVPGGVARCMAMNLRQLGFETSLYSAIGADIFGEFIRRGLVAADINTELLRTSVSKKTALFSVMGAQGSSSSCVYSNSVLQEITADTAFTDFIAREKIDTLVLDSNLSVDTLEAIYGLKEQNSRSDSTPRADHGNPLFIFQNATSPDIAKKSLPWASLVDLFAANEFEAAAILGCRPNPDENTAQKFRALGYRNFIITFGGEGVLVGIKDKTWVEAPYKTTVIVDTIGAGDAFASGFLYGYLGGKSEKKCIQYGLACAKETLATRDTVCSFLTAEFIENYPHATV
jgi:sugar/nucleoside kinase (ribokinase family)